MYAFEVLNVIVLVEIASCSIGGLTYMDSLNLVPSKPYLKGEDPCNPLYWYPRQIPDYCYDRTTPPSKAPVAPPRPAPPPLQPMPPQMPIPMPMPVFIPMPGPPPMSGPSPMPVPFPGAMPIPQPFPAFNAPSQFPMPGYPSNLFVGSGVPYPGSIQTGLVPGVNGLVSPDRGINILPFSDAYSDLLEKHKQKMIRLKLQKLLDEYDRFKGRKYSRKHGCHSG